ncbi:hypothetical protein LPJ59_005423 [Coemansia sp. RSA 2399]|nr:hypothetical protein LPJ59_005423 [Coemansia sp. RSA 2399]KAJ1893973.1 hypothetical protein LPJ81_005258 [Coemansia sp. IMI 209127]
MSSVSSDDILQDLRDSPLQEPAATQDPIFTHDEENESTAEKPEHEKSPSPLFPNDVPMLRSCENCRRKKRKCSGDKPTCTRCAAQGEGCTYRPTARYFKPRANGMGHSSKKRASMDHVSSAGGGSMVTKSRFHHTANNSGFGGFDSARRPRAMSTVTAALGNMHGTHMSIMNGSQGAMRQQQQQQRMSVGVTALAPADLMLSPAVAGAAAQADILTSPSTPSLVQPGSAPCFRQFGDAPLTQQQQQQQYLQMQHPKMAFGNVNGLAYMMPPVGGGDEDATASSSTYYTSTSTNSTPPQLLLNMDFSFAQSSSAAQQPLLSSMAMSMNSDVTVTSPLLSSKHQQQQQQQSMYPSVVGVASDNGVANRVVSSPQSMLADGDYVNMFANTMKSQQQSGAVMMMKTPMASVGYTPASSGSLMYSSPALAMSSYPLYSPTQATTAAAAAAAMAMAAAANGGGMWPTMSAGTANGTGAMMTPNPQSSVSPSLNLQQAFQPEIAAGPMDVGIEYMATPGSTAAGSMMAATGGVGGLDFILPQNKNLFSEWLA